MSWKRWEGLWAEHRFSVCFAGVGLVGVFGSSLGGFWALEYRRYFTAPAIQMKLPLNSKPTILLCGCTCSGKTTASQHLARQFGYLHVEASDFMHLSYYYRHGYRGPTPIGDFAESALAQQPTIAAEKVVEYARGHLLEPIVISGFRAPAEIEYLEAELKMLGKSFEMRFVEADEAARFARLQARARPGDNLTINQFRSRDDQQRRKVALYRPRYSTSKSRLP